MIPKHIYSHGALMLAAALWGLSFAYQKNFLDTIHPLIMTGYGYGIPGIALLVLLALTKHNVFFRWREGVVLGVLIFLLEAPQTIGLSLTTPTNTSFITGMGILLVPLLEKIFYNKKIGRSIYLCIALALAGLAFLTGGLRGLNTGDIWVMGGAIALAFYIIYTDRFEKEKHSSFLILCAQQFLIVACLSLFFAFGTAGGAPFVLRGLDEWWAIFVIGLVFNTIPYVLVQWGEQSVSVFVSSFIYNLEPAFTILFAWLILGLTLTSNVIFGGFLIFLALLFSEYYVGRKTPFVASFGRR